MKSIIFLTTEFPPLPGGIGNHAVNLAGVFSQQGSTVTVITDFRTENCQAETEFDRQLPFNVRRVRRRKILLFTYLNRFIVSGGVTSEIKPEAIISSGKFMLWIGALLKFVFRTPRYVAILHGSELHAGGRFSRAITRWALSRFDRLIAVSNFTRALALNINKKLIISVINNGISLSKPSNVMHSEHKTISIITVGNVSYRKGQQNVIRALPFLKGRFAGIHYHVVGIPSKRDDFLLLAKELNVAECVTFHGALSDNDLRELLPQCTVFFMLSDSLPNGDVEGFGIAVLEANYYGLPAIGSANTGIADAIKDHYSGILVDPHNPEQILIALTEIMNDYDAYSSHARAWAQPFNWDEIVKHYIDVLKS